MKETIIKPKSFGDSDICSNEERVNPTSQQTEMVKLTGILTSRIEKKGIHEPYYYGFFKIPQQNQETPVIFKDQEGHYKPTIPQGSQVQLKGQ